MSNKVPFGLVAAAALLSLDNTPSLYADVVLPPGSVWEYTFSDPTGDPAWFTGGGVYSTGLAPFGNAVGGDFGNNTIWPVSTPLWVRAAVDLTGFDLSTLHYDLGVDNGYELYANGSFVAGANAEGFTFRWEYSGGIPSSDLTTGLNVFAVTLEDHGGLTAFDMQLTADKLVTGVLDDNSTRSLLLGTLLAIFGFSYWTKASAAKPFSRCQSA